MHFDCHSFPINGFNTKNTDVVLLYHKNQINNAVLLSDFYDKHDISNEYLLGGENSICNEFVQISNQIPVFTMLIEIYEDLPIERI